MQEIEKIGSYNRFFAITNKEHPLSIIVPGICIPERWTHMTDLQRYVLG